MTLGAFLQVRGPCVLRRGLAMRPLDQQRLFRACSGAPDRRGAHLHAGKARAQRIDGAIAPCDGAAGVFWQAERHHLGAHALIQIPRDDQKARGNRTGEPVKSSLNLKAWLNCPKAESARPIAALSSCHIEAEAPSHALHRRRCCLHIRARLSRLVWAKGQTGDVPLFVEH